MMNYIIIPGTNKKIIVSFARVALLRVSIFPPAAS